MGIEPTRTGYRPSPVLKTGAPTRNAYASVRHAIGMARRRERPCPCGRAPYEVCCGPLLAGSEQARAQLAATLEGDALTAARFRPA